jgi:hypothetical protein
MFSMINNAARAGSCRLSTAGSNVVRTADMRACPRKALHQIRIAQTSNICKTTTTSSVLLSVAAAAAAELQRQQLQSVMSCQGSRLIHRSAPALKQQSIMKSLLMGVKDDEDDEVFLEAHSKLAARGKYVHEMLGIFVTLDYGGSKPWVDYSDGS